MICPSGLPSAPIDVSAATMDGDLLTLLVGYGGCGGGHPLALCWNELFMESWPVQVSLQLDHDDIGEACLAYIMEERTFDLSMLRESYQAGYQSTTGTIVAHVSSQSVDFTF